MIMLPPPDGPSRPNRRARDRRAADRYGSAKAKVAPVTEPDGPDAPASQTEPVEPSSQTFRARGRGGGRRKTDREEDTQGGSRSAAKPHAPLVAQLIATALNLEQTRVKRRGSEKDAAALYARKPDRAKPPRGEA